MRADGIRARADMDRENGPASVEGVKHTEKCETWEHSQGPGDCHPRGQSCPSSSWIPASAPRREKKKNKERESERGEERRFKKGNPLSSRFLPNSGQNAVHK